MKRSQFIILCLVILIAACIAKPDPAPEPATATLPKAKTWDDFPLDKLQVKKNFWDDSIPLDPPQPWDRDPAWDQFQDYTPQPAPVVVVRPRRPLPVLELDADPGAEIRRQREELQRERRELQRELDWQRMQDLGGRTITVNHWIYD